MNINMSRIKNLWNRKLTKNTIKTVVDTLPVNDFSCDDLVIVSQVHHDAIYMAILALKSFLTKLGKGRVEIIDDGSLTDKDIDLLKYHFPKITIVKIESISLGSCPSGGTWERLVHILELTKHSYVIQVDSDTLTIGPVDDLYDAIENNAAFIICDPVWANLVSIGYINKFWLKNRNDHIQIATERKLIDVKSVPLKRYARGCSAFTGFPQGLLSKETLQDFSTEMESFLGESKWREWGSEQVSSNVMLSLCPELRILPWPKYLNFGFPFIAAGKDKVEHYLGHTSVVHFIGTNRYQNGVYKKLAKEVIEQLK